ISSCRSRTSRASTARAGATRPSPTGRRAVSRSSTATTDRTTRTTTAELPGVRGAVARNILKAWILAAILAAIFACIGWLLADERGAALFAFASLLAAAGAYAVGHRALLGMLGAREYALAEDPRLSSTVDRLAGNVRIAP